MERKKYTSKQKAIAREIVCQFFGGVIPRRISDLGRTLIKEEDIERFASYIEMFFIDAKHRTTTSADDFAIHELVTAWLRKHNK